MASILSSAPSGPPPSYSKHENDELLPPGTQVQHRRQIPQPTPGPSTSHADNVSQMLAVLRSPEELRLTLDNNSIYPPPPSNALYHLPRVLTWSGNEMSLFRSLPSGRTEQPPREYGLYTMRRTLFTSEIALMPRREGLKIAIMRGRRNLLGGRVWEVEVKNELAIRHSRGKWKDKDGKVIAEEILVPGQNPVLIISAGSLEVNMKDLLVSAWISALWQEGKKLGLFKQAIPDANIFDRYTSNVMRWQTFAKG